MEPTTSAEACQHALRHTRGPLDDTWREERWSKGRVEVAALRTAHSDFDGKPVIKNERMTAILARYRSEIADGSFPRSERIVEGGPAPAVMIERDDAGELFVADGQGRALSALWNGIDDLDAYLFSRPGTRELPTDSGQRDPD